MLINHLHYPQATPLEYYPDGMETIPGYLVDCTNDHTYLVFAPDMSSLKHIRAYYQIMKMVKSRMSDHDYDPIRYCIYPAQSSEFDEDGQRKVFHAPASEMGKIYVVK